MMRRGFSRGRRARVRISATTMLPVFGGGLFPLICGIEDDVDKRACKLVLSARQARYVIMSHEKPRLLTYGGGYMRVTLVVYVVCLFLVASVTDFVLGEESVVI